MILILAGRYDPAARNLASHWEGDGAGLVSPDDLTSPGWRHYVGAAGGGGTAAIGGRAVPETEIGGILTRLTWIAPDELTHIVESDRAYVAAEISAFLLSWLSSLSCPIINRPTPGCLAGPPWRAQQWAAAAASVGLQIFGPGLRTGNVGAWPTAGPTITIVGGRCFGLAAEALGPTALQLARLAQVDLLELSFDPTGPHPILRSIDPFPTLDDPEIRGAVLDLLRGPRFRHPTAIPDLRPWRTTAAKLNFH